jgi:hypothetical protein
MESLSLITAIQPLVPSHLAGEQQQRPPFSPGQLVQGVITAKGDARQFTLDINGHKITAESSAQLQIGQKLNLQVASMAPRIELQIVSSNPTNRWLGNVLPLIGRQSQLFSGVTAFAGDPGLMSQLSTTAQETLRFYAQGMQQGAAEGRFPPAFLTRLGVNMEQLLAQDKPAEAAQTLKFALLELSQQTGTTDKSPLTADQLTKTLELYQLLQIRLANESLFFLPLPFSFLLQGYLLIDTDRSGKHAEGKQQSSDADHTVELHLRLEGLGNVDIQIQHKEDRVSLRFLAQDAEKAKFFAEFRQELEQWITHGSLDSVQFLVGAKEPVKTLLEKITKDGAGMIDTRA